MLAINNLKLNDNILNLYIQQEHAVKQLFFLSIINNHATYK